MGKSWPWTMASFMQRKHQGPAVVGVCDHRTEGRLPGKAWQSWSRSREGRLWSLSRIGVNFLLALLKTIIPPLISAPGIKLFTMKTGSLKNKNMSINHESRPFVALWQYCWAVPFCPGPDLSLDQHVKSLKNIFCPGSPWPTSKAWHLWSLQLHPSANLGRIW